MNPLARLTPEQRKAARAQQDAATRAVLDRIAQRHGLLGSSQTKPLAEALRELSQRYNDEGQAEVRTSSPALHAARLHFSLLRDLPKSEWALAEARVAGKLPRTGPIKVLDLGTGLGATSLGALRALAHGGFAGEVQLHLVEPDERALKLALEVVASLVPPGLSLKLSSRVASVQHCLQGADTYDLILLGQVLSEDARELNPAAREERHVHVLRSLVERLTPSGTLLVVEPALRVRARHLHAVRDRLVAAWSAGGERCSVFAPCPHAGPCGALSREQDWCHEDRPLDLPQHLVAVARAAGLRYQGLTYSYLVLRRDGARFQPEGSARLISAVHVQKGKRSVELCAVPSHSSRLEWLERDAKGSAGAAMAKLGRGDWLGLPPGEAGEPPSRVRAEQVELRSSWSALQ